MEAAGDRADEAVAIAERIAHHLGLAGRPEVLHLSNNVVVRVGTTVLKVGRRGGTAMEREVALAAEGVGRGAPVLQPQCDVIVQDPWVISAWPFVAPMGEPQPAAVAAALAAFHDTMRASTVEVPTLADVLRHSAEVAADGAALSAIDGANRTRLNRVLRRVADAVEHEPCVVVHGEPHDGNTIASPSGVVLIDLESTKQAPVEWDLAFRPPGEVDEFWPLANRELLELLRLGVSAQVSTYCWRHVTARPHDVDMRWHAEHHLDRVASSNY